MKTRLTLIILAIALSGAAQTKVGTGRIIGKVTDELNKPMDYATVNLLRAKDSSLVKAAMTAADGNFQFDNTAPGNYLLAASMTGHKKVFGVTFLLEEGKNELSVATLMLTPQSRNLKEVAISVQKPFIERKMDRLVVNVESSTLSAGSTAMEVLEKSPGITIDKDDNISMKGKQGVLIMLDGKPTYMSSADVANMLRNMQSSQIETIELITSPSAKYDAAGTSGIINIRTRKSKNIGLNGSVTAGTGYGKTSKYNGGTTLNYRNAKMNMFGNYNYANNGRLNTLDLARRVNYQDTVTTFNQLNDWDNRRFSNSYKAGIDYFVTKNHTIGVLVNGYSNKNDERSTSNTSWLNNFNQAELINVAGNNSAKFSNLALNFNYKGVLNKRGDELSADLDYSDYSGNEDEIRDNRYQRTHLPARSSSNVKNYSPATIDVRSVKIDYSRPLTKVAKMEAGMKTSFVKTDNDLLFARLNGGEYVADTAYTNHFVYDENIYAGYLNFSTEFKHTGIQAGLRAEQTASKGTSITKKQVVERDYLRFFPSISISQKLNKDHQFGLSYSRRVDRPSYDDLNPFMSFLDEYTFKKGNPFLNPQFTSSFDLSHTFKGKFTTSLSYSHTKDVMATVTEQDDATKRTFAIQRNLDKQNVINLTIYAPVSPVKWWNINNNFQVFRMNFKSASNGGTLDAGQTAVSYNMDHAFTINQTTGADLSAQYQSPMMIGIFKIQSQVVLNAGIKRSFNNKMTVRMSLNDILNSRRSKLSTTYQNMNLNFTEKGESQIARLTLSYRFGKNEIKPARRRSTGLDDEQSRMKN